MSETTTTTTPAPIGSTWDTGAGNHWQVVQVRGDLVQVQLVHQTLRGGGLGSTHWWHVSSLVNGRRLP